MASVPITDELVSAAAQSDAAAMRAMWDTLSPAVFGYLRARGVDDAEATTSDVFLQLFARIADVRGGAEGVRRLAFTIAHARMVDDRRARARRPRTVAYEADRDLRTSEGVDTTAAVNAGTESALHLLAALPDSQRDVLALRFIADLSVEQVAAVLGRSTGAVKQLQRRGLLEVRRAIEQHADADGQCWPDGTARVGTPMSRGKG